MGTCKIGYLKLSSIRITLLQRWPLFALTLPDLQLGDEIEESIHTLCISQEEMCGGLDEVKGKRGIKKLVVFSLDMCKMFPSMVAADVARVVREEYKSVRLEVEVDDNELSLALAREGWLFKNP